MVENIHVFHLVLGSKLPYEIVPHQEPIRADMEMMSLHSQKV